jgi:IS5 family transposase
MNKIVDGIMRKETAAAKLTDYEKERNKQISKKRYIVEQYFGLFHLHNNASRARFPNVIKNAIITAAIKHDHQISMMPIFAANDDHA